MKGMEISDFAFAADGNYVMPLRVAVASLLHACRFKPRAITVHILDVGIPDGKWNELAAFWIALMPQAKFRRHIVSAERYKGYRIWNGSLATYARLELPDLLPDVDWCFYFDCDILITRDPAELEEVDVSDLAILGQLNYGPATDSSDGPWLASRKLPFDPRCYVCAGVLLMNLSYLRRTNGANRCFDFLERHPDSIAADQVALNVVCFGHIGLLPPGWGVFSIEAMVEGRSGCIHYSGKLPWRSHRGWLYFCGEHKLERLWRRFAVRVGGCSMRDFENLPMWVRIRDFAIALSIRAIAETVVSLRLYPTRMSARMERIRRRFRSDLIGRLEMELFSERG